MRGRHRLPKNKAPPLIRYVQEEPVADLFPKNNMTALTFHRTVDIKNKKDAESICGSLSTPSKIPCHGYSIPATECKVGSVLRKVKGSVCANCYALKGRYLFPNVEKAMRNRFGNLYHPQWVEAMVFLIRQTKNEYFRWHDSGDLQSLAHLINIVRVAEELPNVRFWLPTREKALVAEYRRSIGAFPGNLAVRVSVPMVDGAARGTGLESTVHTPGREPAGQHICPAHWQDNKCGACRACWDPAVAVVSYRNH